MKAKTSAPVASKSAGGKKIELLDVATQEALIKEAKARNGGKLIKVSVGHKDGIKHFPPQSSSKSKKAVSGGKGSGGGKSKMSQTAAGKGKGCKGANQKGKKTIIANSSSTVLEAPVTLNKTL